MDAESDTAREEMSTQSMTDDPAVHSDARKLSRLTHMEVLEKDLKVMDLTAATLCRDNHIKIHVFAIAEEGNVMRAIVGEDIGTIIE